MAKEIIEQSYDWLVIFLIYNNNYYDLNRQDTKDYYTMDEQTSYIRNQIRYTRYNKKVKTILVELKIENTKENDEIVLINASISMLYKKKGIWLSAVDGIWRETVPPDGMTSPESLIDILSFLKKRYNADKHMLITAGHGSITGINYYLLSKRESTRNKQTNKLLLLEGKKSAKDKDKPVALPLNGFTENLLFLSNKEINDAVKEVWGGTKIDVLVMYNCLMQSLLTQFEFKDTVDWLVAPLSGISIPGFNYGSILDEISLNSVITGKEISELFMKSVRAGNSYTLHREDIEGTWKLSATQINKEWLGAIQEDFENLFKEINTYSITNGNTIATLSGLLRYLFSYSNHCSPPVQLFDVGSFLNSLKEKFENKPGVNNLLIAINKLSDTLDNNMQTQFNFEGGNFYKIKNLSYYENNSINLRKIKNVSFFFPIEKPGLSIFDPVFDETLDNFSKLENPQFISLHYKKILNKLHKLMPLSIG